jgi:secondary thiamine-phosphate synthase enzyme
MERLKIDTSERNQFVEITDQVSGVVSASGIATGRVLVYVPHTTAGITINENADPDVVDDMLAQLNEVAPHSQRFYRHAEGNSAAHVKASLMGASVTVLLDDGRMILGRWQGIFLCDFDGPRTRQVIVQVAAS